MMPYWIPLTQDCLAQVFNEAELATLKAKAPAAALEAELGDMVAAVRQAVAQNRGNRLPADAALIPRSLRGPALDILALRLLKRYALKATDERRTQAERAQDLLKALAEGKELVLDEAGLLPADPASSPAIIAPAPAYGNNGAGWWPKP